MGAIKGHRADIVQGRSESLRHQPALNSPAPFRRVPLRLAVLLAFSKTQTSEFSSFLEKRALLRSGAFFELDRAGSGCVVLLHLSDFLGKLYDDGLSDFERDFAPHLDVHYYSHNNTHFTS